MTTESRSMTKWFLTLIKKWSNLLCSNDNWNIFNNFKNMCNKICLRKTSNSGHSLAKNRILPKRT